MNPTIQTPRSRPIVTWLLIAAVILLIVLPLALVRNAEFGGADDAASNAIAQLHPGYQPWFHSLWTPPSSEVESLLFAVQAALGAGGIGYILGLKRGAAQARTAAGRQEERKNNS